MEAKLLALGALKRYDEALALSQFCLKTREDHPELFPNGGKVPFDSFSSVGRSLAV
jgi:hypothetical protein